MSISSVQNKIIPTLLVLCISCWNMFAHAALPTDANAYQVNAPVEHGGAILGITALRWETSSPQYDYAFIYPPLDDNGQIVPFLDGATYRHINRDPSWNAKILLGYAFPGTGNEVTLSYIGYQQGTNASTTLDPFTVLIIPTISNNWPTNGSILITNPLLITTNLTFPTDAVNPNLVNATLNTNANIFDVNFTQAINFSCQTRIKYYGGARYANLKNTFDVIYNYSALDLTPIQINGVTPGAFIDVNLGADFTDAIQQASQYSGAGPQIGINFSHSLAWGFGFVTDVSTSLLVGRHRVYLTEQLTKINSATTVDSTIPLLPAGTGFASFAQQNAGFSTPNQARMVPNIDMKIGFDFSYQYCNVDHTVLTIEAGYMISHFFNVTDQVVALDNDAPEYIMPHSNDLHFEGLYFGLQVRV